MNNCLVLLLLLCCCGNNGSDGRGRNISDRRGCGGRESRNDGRGRNREDSGRGGFGAFPTPGSTCGCEEKDS